MKVIDQLIVNPEEIDAAFENLPMHYKLLVTKSDIKMVLRAKKHYHILTESQEQNITGFLDVVQYAKREASQARSAISTEAIKEILDADHKATL